MAGYILENSSKYRCVASIHAAVPFMYLLHPEFFKTEKVLLDVDCSDGAGRGATLCDFRWWLHDEEKIKDMILTDADTERFQQELSKRFILFLSAEPGNNRDQTMKQLRS